MARRCNQGVSPPTPAALLPSSMNTPLTCPLCTSYSPVCVLPISRLLKSWHTSGGMSGGQAHTLFRSSLLAGPANLVGIIAVSNSMILESCVNLDAACSSSSRVRVLSVYCPSTHVWYGEAAHGDAYACFMALWDPSTLQDIPNVSCEASSAVDQQRACSARRLQ